MSEEIDALVAGLGGLTDVRGVYQLTEQRSADGDVAFLADLGIALTSRYADEPSSWQYRGVFDHVLRLLALGPGRASVEQFLRLFASAQHPKRCRYAASLLASGQEPDDLTVVFRGAAPEELRACLVHELVLRGVAVAELPGIAGWATSPHWKHHPLAWLPLTLMACEGRPDLPRYGPRGGADPLSAPWPRTTRQVSAGDPVAATETTAPDTASQLASAVRNWADESNGRIEARAFTLTRALPPEAVAATLRSLRLACLGRSTPELHVYPLDEAWRELFLAASTGGAYNHGEFGAYGRLAAWRSVAALVGSPAGASAAEVAGMAAAADWYAFGPTGTWFDNVAWDLGLVAVSPDGRRLAVLAATDTD